jgi:hypothetical protein
MFRETFATIGDMHNPTFSSPTVKEWNTTIGSARDPPKPWRHRV